MCRYARGLLLQYYLISHLWRSPLQCRRTSRTVLLAPVEMCASTKKQRKEWVKWPCVDRESTKGLSRHWMLRKIERGRRTRRNRKNVAKRAQRLVPALKFASQSLRQVRFFPSPQPRVHVSLTQPTALVYLSFSLIHTPTPLICP